MSKSSIFNLAAIRNYNFVKMDASGISCICSHEAGESTAKDVEEDINKDIVKDGISNEDIDATKNLGTLDDRALNLVKDLILLATSSTVEIRPVVEKIVLDLEDQIMMAVAVRLTKLLIAKELHEYEDPTIMAERLNKAGTSNYLHDLMNWRITTCVFDLFPG